MILFEVGDGVVVGMMPGSENPESHVFICFLFYLSGRGYPQAIRVEEELHHHGRVIGRLARKPTTVRLFYLDLGKVELIHHIRDEVRYVSFGQPLTKRGRQQEKLVRIVGLVVSAHGNLPVFPLFYKGIGGLWRQNIPTDSYVFDAVAASAILDRLGMSDTFVAFEGRFYRTRKNGQSS
jgi:hypothetical protein